MLIKGMHKASLIDWPPRIVSTLFTGGCNFSCPWCQNPQLVNSSAGGKIEKEEIHDYIRRNRDMLEGICLSGGEPLVQNGLLEFLEDMKKREIDVKLDTNGYFPSKLHSIIEGNLVKYIAMDVKAPLREEPYARSCGIGDIDISRLKESIYLIRESGIGYEFRTTVVPGIIDEKEARAIAKFLRGSEKYVLQKFQNSETLDKQYTAVEPFGDDRLQRIRKAASEYIDKVEVK